MLSEQDLKQIKNLVLSFYKEHKYFPLTSDLLKKYKIFFPENLDEKTKKQIDDFINEVILEEISNKKTKGSKIMVDILKRNDKLWKDFRKLNTEEKSESKDFQKLGKEVEKIISAGEDKLTEKLVGHKSMGIEKTSESWYNMVYAIFPEWNKIK